MNRSAGNIWVFIKWLSNREFDGWTVRDPLTCLLTSIKAKVLQILWELAEEKGAYCGYAGGD